MDQLVLGEMEALPGDPSCLIGEAAGVDFDSAFGIAVECQVLEPVDIEVAVELAVDAFEEVEVERGSHPGSVVVRSLEDVDVLLQIDADQHLAPRPEDAGVVGEKSNSGVRLEITDRRAREKSDAFPSGPWQRGQ